MLKKLINKSILAAFLTCSMGASQAAIIGLNLIEDGDDPTSEITDVLVGDGVTLVSDSSAFIGRVGDGVDANTAQSAIFDGLNIFGGPTLGPGVFLTSGVANIPDSNTDSSFDHGSVGILSPGTGSDADLSNILLEASAPSSVTNDVNIIEFDFTLDDDSFNAVSFNFVFGSDEFPDQGVTDVFGVFVDGKNFAFFEDGSLVSFVEGSNASNFNDNTGNDFNIEYDGFSDVLTLVGLVNPDFDTHTIKIAIADTGDSIYDSGVFISNLIGFESDDDDGGVTPNPVSTPSGVLLVGLGLMTLYFRKRRLNK